MQLAVRQLQGQGAQAPTPDGGGITGALQSLGTGMADLASFGFADELGAGARYLGGKVLPWQSNVTYDQALEEVRGKDKAAQEANPKTYLAGQVLGGIGAARGLGRLGLSGSNLIGAPASLGGRVALGAGEGAAYGGLYGAGSGEGAGGRATEALKNAALGGVVGGALPVVAQGASSAYRNIADRLAAGRVARDAGVNPEVARTLSQVLDADGTLGQQGMANMQRAGNESMLADAGPNARSVLDTAIQRGGPGAVSARRAIDERVARGAQDITTALDDTLGPPQGVFSAREGIRTSTAGARGDAYRAAYDQPINYADPRGQTIEQLIKTRVPQSAINEANALMRVEGASSKQILAKVADDGTVAFETLPDVQQLDYITRGLNEVAKKGEAAGAMGGQTALGRAYEGLSREIRSTLRDVVPEYGQALDVASDAIGQSKAVELGSKALSPSMARDQFADAVEGMSAAERRGVAQGIRSQIDEKIANVTRAVQDGNMDAREAIKGLKDFSSRAARDKLVTLLGEEQAAALTNELDRVATSFELRASVAENSKTYARQAVSGRIDEMTAPGAVGTLAQGKPLNAVQRVAQALTGQTPEAIAGRQNAIYSDIADFLTRPADQAIPAFRAMTDFGNQSVANQVRASEIARILSEGGRPLVYPSAALLGK
ncbi:hypothetical protein [Ensifer canadensis]|uniref:hypothetical protein n=1 Tax=Ensifer canadensis TaxID=555315 RepID=UPI0035E3E4BB